VPEGHRPPVVLSIPPATLDELRARRSLRKAPPAIASDRPVLSTVALFEAAVEGKAGPREAEAFCSDMNRLQAEVEDAYDAFLLDPGMGPMTYLTSDGRILCDHRTGTARESNLKRPSSVSYPRSSLAQERQESSLCST
jgi:hypothetical protein